ncbi:MAG TPA: glycerophosphodiester phosphodiesterase family protein, partial [Hydrogenophaga sp.]|nr:glycerophosphodiester phosphodiesterase family protein [Hydrogenophaga sp.]
GRPNESPEPADFVRAVLEVIQRHGMASRTTVQSFDWRMLSEVGRVAPDMPRSHLSAQRERFDTLSTGVWTQGLKLANFADAPSMVAAAGGKLWSPHHQDLSQPVLARARALNLRVVPWTVNEIPDMGRLIDWGVDGIITDYPDRLRSVMQRRGMELPPMVELPIEQRAAATLPVREPIPFGVAPDLR